MKKILPYLTLVVLFFGCNKEPKPDYSFIPGEWEFETIRTTYLLNQYNHVSDTHYHIIDTIYYSGIIKNGVRPQDFTIYYTDSDSINVFYDHIYPRRGDLDPKVWRFWLEGSTPVLLLSTPVGHCIDKNSLRLDIYREKAKFPGCYGEHIYYYRVLGRKKK